MSLKTSFLSPQDKVKSWLNAALTKEEQSWLNGDTPELIDRYRFSPLGVDVIQVSRHLGGAVQVCSSRHASLTMFPDD